MKDILATENWWNLSPEITHGVMESRDHVRNLAIRPGSTITPGRVLDWIREYKLNDDVDVIKTLFGRIRLNE